MNADLLHLHEAFEKFAESSAMLQQKYESLVQETQRLREMIRQKDVEIKKQEKLAMLGETAAAIAHEVRNPLGAIKLFVSLLKGDLEDREDSMQLVSQIDTSIIRLENVVTNILQFSNDKKLSFAPVNLHSIIQEQLLSFPRNTSNTAFFELDLQATPYLLGADTALRQIVYNLILNALQATKYSGQIKVQTRDVVPQAPTDEPGLQMIVRDNGPGIPKELIQTLFEPFVTSKNEGTGLGLSIVKQLVLQHFGSIAASNDNGAVFSVTFPRRRG